MKLVKSAVLGVVAVASFAFVAACGDKGGSDTSAGASSAAPSPTKSLSAADQFSAAVTKTTASTHKFKVTMAEGAYEGSNDPAAGVSTGKLTAEVEPGTKMSIDVQITPAAYYVKISGLPLPGFDGKKWLKIDPSKVKSMSNLGIGDPKDPVDLKDLPGVIATAETTDGKLIKGTLDFTKTTWGTIDDEAVKALGDKAKAVPFEATVDDKGNLATLKVSVPAYGDTKAGDVTATFSDFGAPVTVTTPAASEVEDAPASTYDLLNGA
ncbi:hypothetical protein GCM10010399_74140 [Dactylosporangium fulvum]|uniref:Lipoprotein n=1 Tax=Dactylosporangium fulvum TaxID=53359 RepID=A0ABY5W4B2_9ACTN|nr:hypothetical protein [Dactylosporangium fulvum]UWP84225.1 hypothetical protein Dfulv_08295 [Dactylosporangium fulvum]